MTLLNFRKRKRGQWSMEAPAPVEISFEDGITESLLMTALGQEVHRAEESSMLGGVTYKRRIRSSETERRLIAVLEDRERRPV